MKPGSWDFAKKFDGVPESQSRKKKNKKFHAYSKRQILLSLERIPQTPSKDVDFNTDKFTKMEISRNDRSRR